MRAAVTVSVSMPPADLKMAEHLAKSTNRSVSGVLREGLKRGIRPILAAGARNVAT